MAVLYINEYAEAPRHAMQVGPEPAITQQTVAIGGVSTQSSAFNGATKLIRLHTDAICSIKFGTDPTATATTARMAANQTEYFEVPVNKSYKVAVITNV